MRLSSRWIFIFSIMLAVLGAFFAVNVASAQVAPGPGTGLPSATDLKDAAAGLDNLLDIIRDSAYGWTDKLYYFALKLFWILAGIQFIWTFFPLIFRQADFAELMGELIRFVLMIGFFRFLLQYSSAIAARIVQSFQTAGDVALGNIQQDYGISPAGVFSIAIEIADMISKAGELGVDVTGGTASQGMLPLAGLTIMGSFVFIAAFMVLTLVESWIVINASVLFMGMGGSQWTRDYVISIMKYALAVGAKLFILTLIVGMVMKSVAQWKGLFEANPTAAGVWTIAGLGIVCSYLSKVIPDLVQSLIMGASSGVHGMMMMGGGMMSPMRAAAASANSPGASSSLAAATMMGTGSGGNSGGVGRGGTADMFNASGQLLGAMVGTVSGTSAATGFQAQYNKAAGIGTDNSTPPKEQDKNEGRRRNNATSQEGNGEKGQNPNPSQDAANAPAAEPDVNSSRQGVASQDSTTNQSVGDRQSQGAAELSQDSTGTHTNPSPAGRMPVNPSGEVFSQGDLSQGTPAAPSTTNTRQQESSATPKTLSAVSQSMGIGTPTTNQAAPQTTTHQPHPNQTQPSSSRQSQAVNPVVRKGTP